MSLNSAGSMVPPPSLSNTSNIQLSLSSSVWSWKFKWMKWWNPKLWWNLRHLTSHDELWEVHCTARVFIKYLKKRVGDVLVSCVILLQGEGDKLLLGHLSRRVFILNRWRKYSLFTTICLTHLNKMHAASEQTLLQCQAFVWEQRHPRRLALPWLSLPDCSK